MEAGMAGTYHEYFIQNGQHIGRYEEMYANCPDPWRIEELGPRLDMEAALLLLRGHEKKVRRFLDIGAGLGLFSGLLCERIFGGNPDACGLITDISSTAIAGAEKRLKDPRLTFQSLDIRSLAARPVFPPASFDLLVMAQVLWGVLENLAETLGQLATLLPRGGLFLISQHFPGQSQGYGADIVKNPDDLAVFLRRTGFTVQNTLETNRANNHHWAALAVKES
jgi:SAM-dependent methyltransferase